MTASQIQNLMILSILFGFGIMEYATRRYKNTVNATTDDTLLEVLMFVSLVAVTQPVAIFITTKLGLWLAPNAQGAIASWPWWAMVALLLVGDDMTQYWWHRLSHTSVLWPLHRAHHSAQYMSLRVTFRNNFFYYLLMPGLWIAGALLYLGIDGPLYAVYITVKLLVIIGAHSAWRWDEPLYKIKWMHPVMWVLERTISTPATHWAHHAITNQDGIGHYNGNYGNLLFIWDMIFGSAHITRQYPAQVGLKDDQLFGAERWYHQMFFPLFQSRREYSALRFGGKAYDDNASAESPPATRPAQQ